MKKRYLFAGGFFLLFGIWAFLVLDHHLTSFDSCVQNFFFGLRNPVLNAFCCSLEYLGHWPLPAAICILMLVWKKTRFSYGIPLSACVVTSCLSYEGLKNIFQRSRPDSLLWLCQEHGFSFPSGHTLNNTVTWVVFASLLGYYAVSGGKSLPIYAKDHSTDVYPKTKGQRILLETVLIAWPIIIGLSRIVVGVHWPSDVCGSFLLAAALINLGYAILFTPAKKNG